MKRIIFLGALMAVCTITACKKDKVLLKLDDKNLTGCPTGATCETLFTERADLNANETFKAGDYRLFWARTKYASTSSTLFIKAPMAGSSFKLNSDDIRAGKAFVSSACVSCLMVAYVAVDGEVKGVNTTPNARADAAKWLIEARIIRSPVGYANLRDTIYVKQYFYPNFIYN